jgi:hypothetical protein
MPKNSKTLFVLKNENVNDPQTYWIQTQNRTILNKHPRNPLYVHIHVPVSVPAPGM